MSSSGTRRFLSRSLSSRLYRDEKRTESPVTPNPQGTRTPVSTYTAMKSGLKVNCLALTDVTNRQVSTYAAMKSGLTVRNG